MKHEYTTELELKSILIRIKNIRKARQEDDSIRTEVDNSPESIFWNSRINRYIKWFKNIKNTKYDKEQKKARYVREHLKEKIIRLSENTKCDQKTYEMFGKIILMMIDHILMKPQFSGYSYKDDFISDSVYKILKYIDNFDHTKISQRSGTYVNSFAYISQIIHNAIIFVIIQRKKERQFIKEQIQMTRVKLGLPIEISEDEIEKDYVYLDEIADQESAVSEISETASKYYALSENKNSKLIIISKTVITNIDKIAEINVLKKKHKLLEIYFNSEK